MVANVTFPANEELLRAARTLPSSAQLSDAFQGRIMVWSVKMKKVMKVVVNRGKRKTFPRPYAHSRRNILYTGESVHSEKGYPSFLKNPSSSSFSESGH